MIGYLKITTLTLLWLWTATAFAQTYADKDYYLVDSLSLENLTETDRHLVDSCLNLYHTAKHDTDRVNAINHIVEESWDNNLWPKYNLWVYGFVQEKQENAPGPPTTPAARALRIALAGALNNIGFVHQNQGDIPLALEYYHKGLKIQEEISDKQGMATSYNNIGLIHRHQGDIPLALEYYHKSLKILEEIGNKKGMASSYNNIGVIHKNQGDIPLALEYYHKSLKTSEQIGDKQLTASVLRNIGSLLLEDGKALGMSESSVLGGARKNGERGLKIAQELGFPDQIQRNAGLLSKVARKQGNFKEALEMYELQVAYRDSMKNEETQKASIRQQTRYEFE
ncbi:MAG: tetratricopeptide repeat protein, partial [Flavobacteriales bacterium]|nr:tetratricopeptide repeat protein [Flavobacteriales bacterium]